MTQLTALELAKKIHRGDMTVRGALDACYAVIREKEPQINAFVTLCKEQAYQKAEKIQQRLDRGEYLSPLAGVPIAVKDNILTAGVLTTCSSKLLANYVPAKNAKVVDLLEEAGLVVVGKTNLDEFAMGTSCRTSAFGYTRNPTDTTRIPGGSSGGSAAAVAAGMVTLALGSDTGGSIRNPASHCGVAGLKPAFGAVSMEGVIPYAKSMDVVGPIAGNVPDCLALQRILEGDMSQSPEISIDWTKKKIALPVEFFEDLSDEVADCVRKAAKWFEDAGAAVEEISLPLTHYSVPVYLVLSNIEALDALEQVKEMAGAADFSCLGLEVKRRLLLGTYAREYGYEKKARRLRERITADFARAFERCDYILG
ncbi:MAG: amidase family protein, partial [Oscillospiraceae bacterium]|nr:amidase family protein [Oscillospiraceae bacterium]